MTRTERVGLPRALIWNRSESKFGLDKSITRTDGGQHNWGSINDGAFLEAAAFDDEEEEFEEAATEQQLQVETRQFCSNSFTEEERHSVRQFRKNALKGQDRLTSNAETSSIKSV